MKTFYSRHGYQSKGVHKSVDLKKMISIRNIENMLRWPKKVSNSEKNIVIAEKPSFKI